MYVCMVDMGIEFKKGYKPPEWLIKGEIAIKIGGKRETSAIEKKQPAYLLS